jgi:phytoene dehydrogenase-like protein
LKPAKVIVIGSGVGGSGVAALLQARGCEVVLLERNEFAGGKCWGFEKDGFVVDSGVHMFSMGPVGPHGEIDRIVGGDMQWVKGNPGSVFHMRDSFDVLYYQSQADPRTPLQMVKAAANESAYRRRSTHRDSSGARVGKASNELHGAAARGGLAELIRTFVKLVRRDEVFLSDLDEISTRDFLSRITDNELLHLNIATCSMILLVIPYTISSAGELMWCVSNMFSKAWLSVPKGGSREIPGSWLRSFARNGGRLVLSSGVERILVEDGRATGVVTEDGTEYRADAVISNAGIKRTVTMAGEGSFPAGYLERVRGLKESNSFITVKYGLSRHVVDSRAPCWFNVPNMEPLTMFDYVESGGVPEDPFLFLPIPTQWDSRMAPLGKQLVIMGVPGPTTADEAGQAHCDRILDRAEDRLFELHAAMPENIEWKMRTHIGNTSRITGKPTGECIGLAQSVGQSGVHKPSVKTPVEGLYLVGCDAGARGVGTEQAAGSALYLAGLLS